MSSGFGSLFALDIHTASASNAMHFLYVLHWKGILNKLDHPFALDGTRYRDHVLAMLTRQLIGDTFERIRRCSIPVGEGDLAPVVPGLDHFANM